MAKIVKGNNFEGVIKYIFNSQKNTELLASDGVRTNNNESTSKDFETQCQLNSNISKPVGHISLDFSAQDREKLSNELMVQISHEYMNRMGIKNTQYIIGRHYDKDHPHVHIAYNRVNNEGKTISDKNDRLRSEKICKELTLKYGLYFAKGKEFVKEHRLKEPDKTKYEIYNALKQLVSKCLTWKELIEVLNKENIVIEFKLKNGTNEPQGVKFAKNGYYFSGSKIDKKYSFSKINNVIKQNNLKCKESEEKYINYQTKTSETTGGSSHFVSCGSSIDTQAEAYLRLMKKRKRKGLKK